MDNELPNSYTVLGIDISKNSTGWSVIGVDGNELKLIDYGYIPTRSIRSREEILLMIDRRIDTVIRTYKPNYAAVEQMFIGSNFKTGMILAQIHGIVLLLCAKYGIPVRYYSIMTIKSKVLGGIKVKKDDGSKKTGREMKDEVARKMFEVFGVDSFSRKEYNDDVTDSVSVGYTFFLTNGMEVGGRRPKKTKKRDHPQG